MTEKEIEKEALIDMVYVARGSTLSDVEFVNNWLKLKSDKEDKIASNEETESLKDIVLEEYKKGNIAVFDCEGNLMTMPIKEFIKQPSEGMLYDLNRLESVVLIFINDPKWVNDYAVAKVIKALKARIEELEGNNNNNK